MPAAQDSAGDGLLLALEHLHSLADLVGKPAVLENAGHPIIQAVVLFAVDIPLDIQANSSL